MLKLSRFKGRFDFVVNLFSSFGYFSTNEENFDVLKSMVNCLVPKGKLVLNMIDSNWLLPIFQPVRWSENEGIFVLEASKYDKETHYNESQLMIVDKNVSPPKLKHHTYHRVRLYSKEEIVGLMKKAGLTDIQIYGNFEGDKYKKGSSSHPIYIGTKK
jgi:hypothetical protein